MFFNKNTSTSWSAETICFKSGHSGYFLWRLCGGGNFGPFKSGQRRRQFLMFALTLTTRGALHHFVLNWKWSNLMCFNLMLLPTVNGRFGSCWSKCWNSQNTVNFMGSFTISTAWTDDLIHQLLLKTFRKFKQSHLSKPRCFTFSFLHHLLFLLGPESCPLFGVQTSPEHRRFSEDSEASTQAPMTGVELLVHALNKLTFQILSRSSREPRGSGNFLRKLIWRFSRWWEPHGFQSEPQKKNC